MLTKGEIQAIDYAGNSCTVRIPLFETAGNNDPFILEATISNTPGIYNGYLPKDIVFVSFADNSMSQPVVIGKLYLGIDKESKSPRGAINCSSGNITNDFSMPFDSKLVSADLGTNVNISNNITSFSDMEKVLEALGRPGTSVIEDSDYFGNILCNGPITNLYNGGPMNNGYTSIDMGTYYLILKDGRDKLSVEEVKTYMKYMTGKYVLPGSSFPDIYCGSFTFTDGSTCYPVYQDKELRLYKTSQSTKDIVKKIIEEDGIITTDLSEEEVKVKLDTSLHTSDIERDTEKTDTKYEVINLEENE